MKIDVKKIEKLSLDEVLEFIKTHGSVFVTDMGNDKMFAQYLYVAEKATVQVINTTEELPYKKLANGVWYLECILPKMKNYRYFVKQVLDTGEEKWGIDPYSKYIKENIWDGKVNSRESFALPFLENKINDKLKIEKCEINSKSMQDMREFILVYPENYDKNKKYSVLIFADGYVWFYYQHIESKLNELMQKNKINNYVMCFIKQNDRNKELILNKDFSDFISLELTKYLIDKNITENNPESFTFIGNSMGGVCALALEMYNPGRIGNIIAQSSSLWMDKENKIINYYKNNKINCNLYFSYGIGEVKLITEKDILFKPIIKNIKNARFRIFKGRHEYFAWQDDFIYALKQIKTRP